MNGLVSLMIVFKKLMELSNLMSGLVKDMKEIENPMIVFKKLMMELANERIGQGYEEMENLMFVFYKLMKDGANLMSGLVNDMKDI